MSTATLPELIADAQTTEESFLRHIFVRDQMAEWSQGAAGHGPRRRRSLLGRGRQALSRRPVRHLRRLGRPQQSPRHRRPPQAARHAALLAADARHQPRRRAVGEPAGGAGSRRPVCVKFQCGGSEVTEAAIKLARQYHRLTGTPGKYKVISRYLSWHGSTLGSLSASGLKSRKTVNEPLAPGFLHVFPPTCYRCPFGKSYPDCGITCATLVGSVIEMEDPDTVAAIMVEPIGHTGGIIDPPPEYLPILREICDRYNVLLIFDEIITGIGRTGHLFAAETFGVVPDVLCTAKGLSGGYAPLSAMICRAVHRRRLLGTDRATIPVSWRATPSRATRSRVPPASPYCARSSTATCAATLARQGERLRAGFERLAPQVRRHRRHPRQGVAARRSSLSAIVKTKEPFPAELAFGVKVGRRALANGLLVPLRSALARLRPGAGGDGGAD